MKFFLSILFFLSIGFFSGHLVFTPAKIDLTGRENDIKNINTLIRLVDENTFYLPLVRKKLEREELIYETFVSKRYQPSTQRRWLRQSDVSGTPRICKSTAGTRGLELITRDQSFKWLQIPEIKKEN